MIVLTFENLYLGLNSWVSVLILFSDFKHSWFSPCSLTRPLVSKTLECFPKPSDSSRLTPNLFTLLVRPHSLTSAFSHFPILTHELIPQNVWLCITRTISALCWPQQESELGRDIWRTVRKPKTCPVSFGVIQQNRSCRLFHQTWNKIC